MNHLPLALTAFVLAGCAAAPAPAPTAATPNDAAGIVCTRERPIGSNIATEVCTTAAQRAKARERTEAVLTEPPRPQRDMR